MLKIIILNASVTCSTVAPPPTSKKLAGSPLCSLMISMVAIAKPAPFTTIFGKCQKKAKSFKFSTYPYNRYCLTNEYNLAELFRHREQPKIYLCDQNFSPSCTLEHGLRRKKPGGQQIYKNYDNERRDINIEQISEFVDTR
uniref:Uncharacterized protein n=1 Tax=Romanomermis culicivorax TaxID=13658 RepID=A0A915JKI3_ROMCU